MNMELNALLGRSMFQFRRLMALLQPDDDLPMNERIVLYKLHFMRCHGGELNTTELHSELYITKPAVSQLLRGLEEKEFIKRDINVRDRRRIRVSLTPEGLAAIDRMRQSADAKFDRLIERIGEADIRRLVSLVERCMIAAEEISKE